MTNSDNRAPQTAEDLLVFRGPNAYNDPVRDGEFVSRVQRHRRSSLLPLIALTGARFHEKKTYTKVDAHQYAPWILAEVARVCIIYGTDSFGSDATMEDLWECCRACQSLDDPQLRMKSPDAVGLFMLRMSEQLAYQQRYHYDFARTVALFEQTTPSRPLSVLQSGWPEELLGCTLQEFVGAAFVLWASAIRNDGTFYLSWLTQPQFAEAVREISSAKLRSIIESNYVATSGQLVRIQRRSEQYASAYRQRNPEAGTPDPQYRHLESNPLWSRPAVAGVLGVAGPLLIPVPALMVRRGSPLGIYYSGIDKWGVSFANDLGYLFEAYIGRQLEQISDARIVPAIKYGPGGGQESTDWIVIFNSCVVLVEVKSRRPTEPVRRADSAGARMELKRMLSESVDQLNESARLILERHPSFTAIPSDLPFLGLVVTMEPFHTVNFPFFEPMFPECDIPYRICSALDIEDLVTVNDVSIGTLLADFLTDESKKGWALRSAFEGHQASRNQVIDQGWDTFPWRESGT